LPRLLNRRRWSQAQQVAPLAERLGASPRPGWPVGQKLTATVEYDWAECVRQNCCVAASQMQCSSAFEVGLAGEHHEDSEARVERRLAVQRDTL
jgi:hypothetical protein